MNGSLRIGSIFGIDIRIHYLWFVMVGVAGLLNPVLLLLLPVLFGVVLLHELGHSVVAKHYGVRVVDITLWPLGGMARMATIPQDTKIETMIAIAGPMVNFLLAGLALPFLFTPVGWGFFMINMVLGTFNLLPAFPMDGGRVLRALLAWNGDWLGATEKAVRVGRVFAVLLILAGFFLPVGPMVIVIGLWLLWVGSQELAAVRMRHARVAHGPDFAPEFGPAAAPRGYAPQPDPVTGARRPDSKPGSGAFRGWSEEEIRRLEGFGGPLSQYRRRKGE